MKNLLRVTGIALMAIFITATCQAQEYRGKGWQGYGNHKYTKSNHGNRHDRGYYGGHGYVYYGGHGRGYYGGRHDGYRGYGYNDDAALITGILVGGSIINNMISQPSAPPPEETTCRKSTTTTWENGRQLGSTTTENCEGYRNTKRY